MKMNNSTIIILAARYAHARNTGAAFAVVSYIMQVWDDLSKQTQNQLYRESFEALYCLEDWKMLQDKWKETN